jgi:hypothetical protein
MPTLADLGGSSWLASTAYPTKPTTLGTLGQWRAPVFRDPALVDRLLRYTRAEVGGQGPQAQQAFMEAMTNMAGNRGRFLPSNYFPDITHTRAARPLTAEERARLQPIAEAVAAGSNVANYATGNASGSVGFGKGGYRTASYGGENYGVESADRGWWTKLGLEGPKTPDSVGYITSQLPAGASGARTSPSDLVPNAPRSWGDILAEVAAGFGNFKAAPVPQIPEGLPMAQDMRRFTPLTAGAGVTPFAQR